MEAREDAAREEAEADDLWLKERAGIDPAERRASWRRWLCRELEKSLQWPAEQAARERLIGQCAGELTTLARQLRGRGWLLEGKALAGHVRAVIKPVATAQKAGKIGDFWPYFRAAVGRYVGANAEEIQHHARRSGADAGAETMGTLMAVLSDKIERRQASMTEVLAGRSDEIRAAKREKAATKKERARTGADPQEELPL
jgi:hypothetical protein